MQVVALFQVGAALWMGLETQDARLELKLLLFGAIEFLVGQLLIKATGTQEA